MATVVIRFAETRMDLRQASVVRLIHACTDSGNEAAWTEFIRRFDKTIRAMVTKATAQWETRDPHAIEDAIQDTYVKICDRGCRVLSEFDERSPDSIYGLLKVIAYSAVQDRFRSRNAQKRGAGRKSVPIEDVFAAGVSQPADRGVLIAEVDRELQSASVRDRTIFWLYFRNGLTTRAIAAIPHIGLSQKGVETVIERLAKDLRVKFMSKTRSESAGKASASTF